MRRILWSSLFLILLDFLSLSSALCPSMCVCDIDGTGRKRTRCEGGGINIPGTFDLSQLDADTSVLFIGGSRQRPNTFNLQPMMFQGKRFEEIHLSYSNMDRLPDMLFFYISGSLKVLNLTHNDLRGLGENNFRNLSRLTHLHLDNNRIVSVYSAMFSYLTNLKVLTMSHNLISDVPQRMGLQLTKLEVFDISHNPLGESSIPEMKQTIPEAFFQDLASLRVLNLGNTSIDSIPWNAIQKANLNLQEIDLSNNRIPVIQQNQLSLVRNLKRVSLGGNPIREIQPGALSGLYLDNLDLAGLPATVLNPGIFMQARVFRLDLSNMNLPELSRETFLPISMDLIGLNVSGNPNLRIQSRMFELLPALKDLTMTRMRKTALPADFFSYTNAIEELDLSQNGLIGLEDSFFQPLIQLQRLDLSNNQLQRAPMTINTPRIQEIDLSNNNLQSFPDDLVATFSTPASSLQSLRLNFNPWVCDCGVAGLGRWLAPGSMSPGFQKVCVGTGNFTCPVCAQPSNFRGTPLSALPEQLLTTCVPQENRTTASNANIDVIIAVVVCLIVLIIAILLLVLWYRNRLHSYRTYEEKRKDGEAFEQNGDVPDVFEEVPPISKPKNGLPDMQPSAPPRTIQPVILPKQQSDV